MRIAILIESLDGGGSERVVQRLAAGLADRGHAVFLYCLRAANVAFDSLSAVGVVVREAHSTRRDWGLPWRLRSWLRQDGIEVVHAHSCAALVWTLPAAAALRLPVLHVWHGWPLTSVTCEHRLALCLDRFVSAIGVNSEALRRHLPSGRSATRAEYLPNGLELPLVPRAQARARLEEICGTTFDGPVILNVANVRPEKDTVGLVRAFALLQHDQPATHLVCIGAARDLTYARHVHEAVAATGQADRVRFTGALRDAWRLMAGADVFCLASRSESMPNVVLEAMSQRVPIVATAVGDVGALGDTAQRGPWLLCDPESALLVPPGDPERLAQALRAALTDPQAARIRAERAHETYVRRFTTQRMVARYERVYEGMCRGRGAPGATRRRVLMLGPPANRTGGMVTSIALLMGGPLRGRFELFRAETADAHASDTVPRTQGRGRVGTAALRHGVALARLAATLFFRRIDILHIHTCSHFTFYRNLLDLAVGRLLGCKVVLHIRGGQFVRFCDGAGRWGRRLIRWGLARADAVVVLSERWRTALASYTGRTRVVVVPNAVASPGRAASAPGRSWRCRFLYLAALTEAKGLGDLFAAAGRLVREGVPLELLIGGPETTIPQAVWERRAQEAGLAAHVSFLGPVAGADKAALFAAADCFVHPSHSEGMPNVVLEAAAAGLPVIATAVGSVPDILQPAVDEPALSPLVPAHNPAALALQMRRMAVDEPLRRRTGKALAEHVCRAHSVTRVSDQISRLYEELLGVAHQTAADAGGSRMSVPVAARELPAELVRG